MAKTSKKMSRVLFGDDKEQLTRISEGDDIYQTTLAEANILLSAAGVESAPELETYQDLKDCASSMIVAAFETIFSIRLPLICRIPHKQHEYALNAQLVVDSLRDALQGVNFEFVTGEGITRGNPRELLVMVRLLARLYHLAMSKHKSDKTVFRKISRTVEKDFDKRRQQTTQQTTLKAKRPPSGRKAKPAVPRKKRPSEDGEKEEEKEEDDQAKQFETMALLYPSLYHRLSRFRTDAVSIAKKKRLTVSRQKNQVLNIIDRCQKARESEVRQEKSRRRHLKTMLLKQQRLRLRNAEKEKRREKIHAKLLQEEILQQQQARDVHRQSEEEKLILGLFNDALQRERARLVEDETQYKENLRQTIKQHAERIEIIEKGFRERQDILREQRTEQKASHALAAKAHEQALSLAGKELRDDRERRLKGLREELAEMEGRYAFKHLDADKLLQAMEQPNSAKNMNKKRRGKKRAVKKPVKGVKRRVAGAAGGKPKLAWQ